MQFNRKYIAVFLFSLVLSGYGFSCITANVVDQSGNKSAFAFSQRDAGQGYISFFQRLLENEDSEEKFSDNLRLNSLHIFHTRQADVSYAQTERIFRPNFPRKKVYLLHAVFLL
jgi:hypothetical protein